jgi:histidinol-phosphate/aromatic aminotransferase/cobyric acid decarboxylase-like protein
MSTHEEGVQARVHGGVSLDELAEIGIDLRETIDFSASINPYGPCPAVLHAARACHFDRYPDATAAGLRRAIASAHDIAAHRIVVGNGAADLLWTLAHVLVAPGANVVISEPTFAEFRSAVVAARGRVLESRAGAARGFAADVDAIEALAQSNDARVVYLASPNTPVGTRVPVERIASLAENLPQATVILDQAFVSLSDHPGDEKVAVPDNVVRVRSLTKDHAIAGLRLGYLIAASELAGRIEAHRPPWMTNAVAEAAGIAAVRANLFVEETRALLRVDRDELAAGLRDIGLGPLPSTACFLTFGVPNSAVLRRRMLLKGILVRDCTSFGMPGFVRVAARPKADRERLLQALAEELPRAE